MSINEFNKVVEALSPSANILVEHIANYLYEHDIDLVHTNDVLDALVAKIKEGTQSGIIPSSSKQ